MKVVSECPICKRKPLLTLRSRIYPLKYKGIQRKVADAYFSLTKEEAPEEMLSCCFNCRSVYRAKFFDHSEINQIYSRLYYDLEKKIFDDPNFSYNKQGFLDGCSKQMLNQIQELESRFSIKICDIFDIGGRDGFRLKDLACNGYNCTVFDPIPCLACDNKINKEYIWLSQIKKGRMADFISLCNVLEHCIEPNEIIKDCYGHLKEGGFLYVELPLDIETVFEWLLFRAWRKENLSIDNTHYIFYSQRTITSLLESTRFDCIKRWIWLLPSEKVNVLGVLAQKKRLSAVKTSKRLSWDFDLLGSGYFLRLYFKMIDKLRKQVTALKI